MSPVDEWQRASVGPGGLELPTPSSLFSRPNPARAVRWVPSTPGGGFITEPPCGRARYASWCAPCVVISIQYPDQHKCPVDQGQLQRKDDWMIRTDWEYGLARYMEIRYVSLLESYIDDVRRETILDNHPTSRSRETRGTFHHLIASDWKAILGRHRYITRIHHFSSSGVQLRNRHSRPSQPAYPRFCPISTNRSNNSAIPTIDTQTLLRVCDCEEAGVPGRRSEICTPQIHDPPRRRCIRGSPRRRFQANLRA